MTGKLRSSQFLRVWFPKCDIIQEIDEKLLYHEKTKKRALLAILFQIRLQKFFAPLCNIDDNINVWDIFHETHLITFDFFSSPWDKIEGTISGNRSFFLKKVIFHFWDNMYGI